MSEKRYFGFGDFGAWVKTQVAEVTQLVNGKLGLTETAVNSERLEGKTLAEVISRITNGEVGYGDPSIGFTASTEWRHTTSGQQASTLVGTAIDAGFNMSYTAPNENGELVYTFDGQNSYNVEGFYYGQNSSGVYEEVATTLLMPGEKVQDLKIRFAPTEVTQMRATIKSVDGSGQNGFYFRESGGAQQIYTDASIEFTLDPDAVYATNPQENAQFTNYITIAAFNGSLGAIAHLSQVTLVLERLVDGQWINIFLTGAGGLSLVALDSENDQLAQRVAVVESNKLNADATAADSATLGGQAPEYFATAAAVTQLEADVNAMLTDLTTAFQNGADTISGA